MNDTSNGLSSQLDFVKITFDFGYNFVSTVYSLKYLKYFYEDKMKGFTMKKRFRINLRDAHAASKKTVYRVATDTGLIYNTVAKYASDIIEADILPAHVITLAEYYGLDWHDPKVIEVHAEENESSGQIKTLLAAAL